jgi:hypothetical protein
MALARGGLTSGMKDLNAALSNNSKNVFNLISDEAFSWPNNTKKMALKRQLQSPLTTIGVESDHC